MKPLAVVTALVVVALLCGSLVTPTITAQDPQAAAPNPAQTQELTPAQMQAMQQAAQALRRTVDRGRRMGRVPVRPEIRNGPPRISPRVQAALDAAAARAAMEAQRLVERRVAAKPAVDQSKAARVTRVAVQKLAWDLQRPSSPVRVALRRVCHVNPWTSAPAIDVHVVAR